MNDECSELERLREAARFLRDPVLNRYLHGAAAAVSKGRPDLARTWLGMAAWRLDTTGTTAAGAREDEEDQERA